MLLTTHFRKHRMFLIIVTIVMLLAMIFTMLARPITPQVADAAASCASPPAKFDATKATNAQLQSYGLPRRISNNPASSTYKSWLKLVKMTKTRLCNKSAAASDKSESKFSTKSDPSRVYLQYHSGYQVQVNQILSIAATWQVPCPQDYNSAYVRDEITLLSGNTILVAFGTQESHTAGTNGGYGTDTDQFFYAGSNYGYGIDPTKQPIHCGDSVSAQMSYDVTTNPSSPQWVLYIGDANTGAAYTTTIAGGTAGLAYLGEYNGTRPLLKFGNVPWSGAQITTPLDTVNQHPIGQFPTNIIQMQDSQSQGMAYPGVLDSTGASFTDTWYHSS